MVTKGGTINESRSLREAMELTINTIKQSNGEVRIFDLLLNFANLVQKRITIGATQEQILKRKSQVEDILKEKGFDSLIEKLNFLIKNAVSGNNTEDIKSQKDIPAIAPVSRTERRSKITETRENPKAREVGKPGGAREGHLKKPKSKKEKGPSIESKKMKKKPTERINGKTKIPLEFWLRIINYLNKADRILSGQNATMKDLMSVIEEQAHIKNLICNYDLSAMDDERAKHIYSHLRGIYRTASTKIGLLNHSNYGIKPEEIGDGGEGDFESFPELVLQK